MHPANRLLALVGLKLSRTQRVPVPFMRRYRATLHELERVPPDRFPTVFGSLTYEAGDHPVEWWDYECAFAAEHLARVSPTDVLDIGSIRSFVAGLLAHYRVTTVDVRRRTALVANETAITSDARRLDLPDAAFDVVVSLCTIEHFGLGRYGDELDLEGDHAAFAEMVRVLRPGGRLVFSTTLRNGEPALAFNEQRIYNIDLVHRLTKGLICEDERAYTRASQRFCAVDELPLEPPSYESWWHIYCGCWRKPEAD
jgi:SAM-dependent methyltransferase